MSDAPINPDDLNGQYSQDDENLFAPGVPDVSSAGGDPGLLDGMNGAGEPESSWLLEDDSLDLVVSSEPVGTESVQALPTELDALEEQDPTATWTEEEALGAEDPMIGASYVEPETASSAASRALIPAALCMALSFGGIAVWSFVKQGAQELPDDVTADLDVEGPTLAEKEADVELVAPEIGNPVEQGRLSYQRDGRIVPADPFHSGATAKSTVETPREPGELPPSSEETVAGDLNRTEEPAIEAEPETFADSTDAETPAPDVAATEEETGYGTDEFDQDEFSGDDYAAAEETTDGDDESIGAGFLDGFVIDVQPLAEADLQLLEELEAEDAMEPEPVFVAEADEQPVEIFDVTTGEEVAQEAYEADDEAGDDEAYEGGVESFGETVAEADTEPEFEAPVAPLPGDEVFGTFALRFPGPGFGPQSPAFEEPAPVVADAEVEAPAEEAVEDAAEQVAEASEPGPGADFLPFGFFGEEVTASVDVDPAVAAAEFETAGPEPAEDGYESTEEPLDVTGDAVAQTDNLYLGTWNPLEIALGAPEDDGWIADGSETYTEEVAETDEVVAYDPSTSVEDETAETFGEIVADAEIADAADTEDEYPAAETIEIALPVDDDPIVFETEPVVAETSEETTDVEAQEAETVADVAVPALEEPIAAPEEVTVAIASPATPEQEADAHARLDALFGPPAVDEAVETGATEPRISDVFPAPETLANAGSDEVTAPAPTAEEETGTSEQIASADVQETVPATVTDVAEETAPEETSTESTTAEQVADADDAANEGLLPADPANVPDAPVVPTDVAGGSTTPPTEAEVVAKGDADESIEIRFDGPATSGEAAGDALDVRAETIAGAEPGAKAEAPAADEPAADEAVVAEAEPVEVEVMPGLAGSGETPRYRGVVRRISTGDIWPHRTIPKAKMDKDKFVLTPHVGQVRVVFDGGETIDGRLHGVGQNRIVLDSHLGRLTLDGRRADRIDRLGRRSSRPTSNRVSTKGLDLVRVKADGGVFQGHLLSREGGKVTLLLEQGMRITLESDDVQVAAGEKNVSRLRRVD